MVQICGKIQAEFKPVTILQGHFSILTRDLSSKMGIGCGLLKQPCFMIPMSIYGSCYDIKGVKKNIQYILPILCQLYAFKWKLIFHTYMCEVAWSTGQQTSVFFTYSYSTGCYKVKVFSYFIVL